MRLVERLRRIWRQGHLGRTLSLLIAGGVAVLALLALPLTLKQIQQPLREASQRTAIGIADITARAVGHALATGDTAAVRRLIHDASRIEDVALVALVDSFRTPLVQETSPDAAGLVALKAGLSGEQQTYGIYRPVYATDGVVDSMHAVFVALSVAPMDAVTSRSGWTVTAIFLVLIVLGCVLAMGISILVTRPLVDLVDVARDIAGGNLTRRALPSGHRETADLAHALNTMVAGMVKTYRELEGRNADIARRSLELAIAKEQAEEIVLLRDTFLTNMSHEVRTPLAGILATAQILREEIDGPATELVEILEASSKRLLETINDVLELSALEADTQRVQLRTVDLRRALHDAVAPLHEQAKKKGLALVLEPCAHALYAEIDPAAFDRVMNHLVGNAIKFTPAGSVRICLRNNLHEVQIAVIDTGIGIEQEQLPVIFEPFRQGSMGLSRTHEGNGVGLSIARHYVERMYGTIGVESTPGQGSTFSIQLPRVQQRRSSSDGVKRQPDYTLEWTPVMAAS